MSQQGGIAAWWESAAEAHCLGIHALADVDRPHCYRALDVLAHGSRGRLILAGRDEPDDRAVRGELFDPVCWRGVGPDGIYGCHPGMQIENQNVLERLVQQLQGLVS